MSNPTSNAMPDLASGPAVQGEARRTGLLVAGGLGLVTAGLVAGLMLRPATTAVAPASATAPLPAPLAQAPAAQPPTALLGSLPPGPASAMAAPTIAAPNGPMPAVRSVATSAGLQPAAAPLQAAPHRHEAGTAAHSHDAGSTHRHAHAAPPAAPPRAARPSGSERARTASAEPSPWSEPQRKVAVCASCGVVEGVRTVRIPAEASGLGAVAGGVVGGLLGAQVGGGNGRKAMTVLGAVGGTYAGNEVEKRTRAETVYDVRVRMDDGSVRTLQQRTAPAPGSRVRVDGDTLRSAGPARSNEPRYLRTGT